MKEDVRYTNHEAFLLGIKRLFAQMLGQAQQHPELVSHWHVTRDGLKLTITLE